MSRKLKKTVASALALTMMTGPAACFPALQTGIVLNAATAEQVTAVAKAADGIAGPTVDAGTYEVKAGDTFKVKLKATDNADGFNALNCWLDVDTNIFEIVKTEAGDSDNADNEDTSSFSNVTINTYTKEKAAAGVKTLIVLYSDTENLKGDEVLATVTLKVKDDVQADYYSLPFDAVADGGALGNRIVTEEGERKPIVLNPTFKGASVTVGTPAADPTKAPSADPTSETPKGDTIQIEIGEVSGKAGEKVKVPVYAKNIGDGFSALQFDYAIDGDLTVGRGIKGDFGCSWTIGSEAKAAQFLEQDGNNITKDGLIGKLEVEIPADAKDGTVYNFKISNFEGAMVVADSATNKQVKLASDRFTAKSGKITVGEEGSTSASPAPATDTPKGDTIQIELGSVSGDAGTKVKVPVYAKNIGDGFSALQFDYDIDGDLTVGRGIKGDFGCSWTIGSEAKAAQFLEQDGNNITKDGLIGKLEVEIPADAKDGTVYNFKISNFEGAMVDKTTGSQVKLTSDKFSAAAGKITVGEAVEETPSPVPTTVPTNKTASSEQPESKTNIAGAESALKVDAGTYEAKAGDTVKVKIKVSDTKEGFNALNAWLDVDTDVFDIVSCEAGDTDDKDNGDSLAFSNVTINKFHKGDAADNITTVLCLYSDTNNAKEDMVLATIELKVKDVKDGYYALPFDAKGDGGAMANRIVTKDGDRTATVINPTFLGAVVKVGDAEAASPAPTKVPTTEPTEVPTTVPTNKTASSEQPESKTNIAGAESALKIDAGTYEAKAGDTVKVKIKVSDTKDGFNALNAWLDVDTDVFDIVSCEAGDTDDKDNGDSLAFSNVTINKFHKEDAADNITTVLCLYSDTNNANEDMVLATIELKVKDVKDGYYALPFDAKGDGGAMANRIVMKDSDRVPAVINPTYLGAVVKVGDAEAASPAPTKVPTTEPTTDPTKVPTAVPTQTPPESDTIIIKGGEISGNAGEKVKLPIYAENIGEGFSALQFDYKMDKSLHLGRGIKGDFGCSWTISGADYAAQFLEADGMNITKDGCIGKLEIAIDEDTPDGIYEFEMYNFEGSMFDAAAGKQVKLDDSKFTAVSGKIIVGEPAPTPTPTTDPSPTKPADDPSKVPTPTDPATEKPTATTAPTATSVPTAEPTAEPEGFAYDVNGDEVVNTADVIALKKYLLMVYSAKAINGDVNKDGNVNALDMMRLVKKLLE